jgi:4-hydroxy-2-oxoheptanedioate aldolase
MTGTELGAALRSGQRVYGTLIVSHSPKWLELIDAARLDFVFIDTEHIPLDRYDLSWMCTAYQARGMPPVVRIPCPDPYIASTVVDAGACGVIAPYIESADEVKGLVGAVKLRPVKGRKLAEILATGPDLSRGAAKQLAKNNEARLVIANIESVPAMGNLDDILQVPGLDAVLIGPHDLTNSLGIDGQYTHPDFVAAVDEIIGKARAAGVGAGIHTFFEDPGLEQESRWIEHGANLIVHGSDLMAFVRSTGADLDRLRQRFGDERLTRTAPDGDA